MPQLRTSLEYQRRSEPRRRMVLEETDAGATLVFPVIHPAVAVFTTACSLGAAAAWAYMLTVFVKFTMQWNMDMTSGGWIKVLVSYALSAVFWGAVAAGNIIWFRKVCRVPKRLGFDNAGLFWQWPTWRGVRERRWPLQEIVDARCNDVRSILPGLPGADLLIQLRTKRWPLRFRLHGKTIPLARRFVERLNAAKAEPQMNADERG